MRILMISDVYYPRVNGVSTSINTFRSELSLLGVESTLIAPAYDKQDKLVYDMENDIIRVPSGKVMFDPEDRMLKKKYLPEILRFIEAKEYDLIHIQTPFVAHYMGMVLTEKLGIPVVETYHTFFEEYFYHYIPFLPRAWLRFAARRLSRVQCNKLEALVVPSTAMYDKLKDYGIKTDMKIIPTGIPMPDLQEDAGKAFKQKHGIPVDKPALLHVGRIAFEKNIDFLIDVYAEVKKLLPDVILMITGEGPARDKLRNKVGQMGLQNAVYFIGYLDRKDELPACYQAGDIFVFASRTETQGLVLLEAMAMGLPVVSTAEMGTKDILLPCKGAVIAQEDKKDFSGKISTLLQDRQRIQNLSAEARHYAQSWSANAMAVKMLAFYQELANSAETAANKPLTHSDSRLATDRV